MQAARAQADVAAGLNRPTVALDAQLIRYRKTFDLSLGDTLDRAQAELGAAAERRGVSLPARAWLASCFDRDREEGVPPMALLAGAAPRGEDAGPTVCACYGVGRNTLVKAIRTQGLRDTAAVTACLKAGGNCGSCLPEIRSLIAECGVSPATPSAVPGPVSAA